jgi:hypothetical protein
MKKIINHLKYLLVLLVLQVNAKEVKVFHVGASVDLKFYTFDQWNDRLEDNRPLNVHLDIPNFDASNIDYDITFYYDQNYSTYSKHLGDSMRGDYYILGMHSVVCTVGLIALQHLAMDVVLGLVKRKGRQGYKILIIKYPIVKPQTLETGNCNYIGGKNLQSVASQYNTWLDTEIERYGLTGLVYAVDPWKNNFDTLNENSKRSHPTRFAINEARARVDSCIKSLEAGGDCESI